MALHLGSYENLIVNFGDECYALEFYSNTPITNGVRLLTSDSYILNDSNGVYLTTNESEGE